MPIDADHDGNGLNTAGENGRPLSPRLINELKVMGLTLLSRMLSNQRNPNRQLNSWDCDMFKSSMIVAKALKQRRARGSDRIGRL